MKDTLLLVIEIHLILSFSLIFTLLITGVKILGFKKILQDTKSDVYFLLILFEFLICPYRVVLIAFAEVCQKQAKVCDKIKKMTTKTKVDNE